MTTGSTRRVCLPSQRATAGKESETQISARRHCTRCREMPQSSSIYVRPKANRDAHIYERGFSFFSRYSARRATPDTLTTLKRTPGMSPTAWPFRPKPAISTSSCEQPRRKEGRAGESTRQPRLRNLAHRKPPACWRGQGYRRVSRSAGALCVAALRRLARGFTQSQRC